jgi:CRP-like cAMP-binding protein
VEALPSPQANSLLAALPQAVWRRWQQQLEYVYLPLGYVLRESGDKMRHVYFPTTAIVSILQKMEDGDMADVALVGNEGMIGISLFMGGGSTTSSAVVQCAGHGFRLSAQLLKDEFQQSGELVQLLLRYVQAVTTQIAQTAACNRHHSLDQQLGRWLLSILDRVTGDELVMTQELIAKNLGVRREGVTEAARRLQKVGLVSYARGHITVLDRIGIEERACECYTAVKREYARLLPAALATPRMPGLPMAPAPSKELASSARQEQFAMS